MTRRFEKLLQAIRRPFQRNGFLTGVDVGKSSFKIVQLTRGGQGPRLVYAGLLEFPRPLEKRDPGRTAADIQSFLNQKPMKRGPVATAISDAAVTIRYFTLPVMPQDELPEAVQWEAKKLISRPLEDMVLDYVVTGEKEERDLKKMELLLVAADKRNVTEHVLMIRQAGLQAAVVDVNPLALRNLLRLNYPDLIGQNVAVVDIGASNTEISVTQNGGVRFTRHVSIGMDQVTQVIQKELGTSFEEAERLKRRFGLDLARGAVSHEGTKIPVTGTLTEAMRGTLDGLVLEIQRSIDFYHVQFRGEKIRRIVFTGGGILMPGLMPYLSGYFDIETVIDNPFAYVHYDPVRFGELADMAPRFSTAVGLALRPATSV